MAYLGARSRYRAHALSVSMDRWLSYLSPGNITISETNNCTSTMLYMCMCCNSRLNKMILYIHGNGYTSTYTVHALAVCTLYMCDVVKENDPNIAVCGIHLQGALYAHVHVHVVCTVYIMNSHNMNVHCTCMCAYSSAHKQVTM